MSGALYGDAMSEAADSANAVAALASLLGSLSVAFGEQAESYPGFAVEFGAMSLRDAARSAARRSGGAATASLRRLREVRKSLLADVARSVDLGYAVLQEARSEVCPALALAVADARSALRAAAASDSRLFAPAGILDYLEQYGGETVAASCGLPGWRMTADGSEFVVAADGVALWVWPLGDGPKVTWIANVGLVGVAICASPEEAARRAVSAHVVMFGRADT